MKKKKIRFRFLSKTKISKARYQSNQINQIKVSHAVITVFITEKREFNWKETLQKLTAQIFLAVPNDSRETIWVSGNSLPVCAEPYQRESI